MNRIIIVLATAMLFCSCVTSKKYNELNDSYENCSTRLSKALMQNAELKSKLQDAEAKLSHCGDKLAQREQSLEHQTQQVVLARQENEELSKQLRTSNSRINEVLNDKSKYLTELSDKLSKKESELSKKEAKLDSLQSEFAESQRQLQQMHQKIEAQNAQLEQIQSTLKDALLGFENKGLSIDTKDGKVYVSMDEKLLFSSGSWQVSDEGCKALSEIAAVLSINPDINIMVEGHTDNVPLVGKNQVKDNWDLSVMRATSITKILLNESGISPTRILPCGRGQYMPVDNNDTKEGRAKNRRTEIILSPKVEELFNILQ